MVKNVEKEVNRILGRNKLGLYMPDSYFSTMLIGNNIPFRKKFNLSSKIRKEIVYEFNEGLLDFEDIEKRVEELIFERCEGECFSYEDIKKIEEQKKEERKNKLEERRKKLEKRKNKIEEDKRKREELKIEKCKKEILSGIPYKINIKVPYQSTGAASTVAGGMSILGGFGAMMGSWDEGKIKWKSTYLLVLNSGLSLPDFSVTVLYKDVVEMVVGVPTVIVSSNGVSISCMIDEYMAKAIDSIIQNNEY